MTIRNLSSRLATLEKQQGSSGKTIIVWRHDEQAVYEQRLAEAEAHLGPLDSAVSYRMAAADAMSALRSRLKRLEASLNPGGTRYCFDLPHVMDRQEWEAAHCQGAIADLAAEPLPFKAGYVRRLRLVPRTHH